MPAYYNEIDPYAAQWLRNLIAAGHIAPGEVDERSIVDVRPADLAGFTQCHFFAGIGVWSYALRRAGWPDDRPVWTGSCPCQPFSAAGKGDEFADARHLWPAWFRLIRECRPVVVVGEQVAGKDALAWIDHVSTDLEGQAYTFGAVDTCSAGFGAPHIRQRFFWVGHARGAGMEGSLGLAGVPGRQSGADQGRAAERAGVHAGWLAHTDGGHAGAEGLQRGRQHGQQPQDDGACRLADSSSEGRGSEWADSDAAHGSQALQAGQAEPGRCGATGGDRPGPTNGYWRDVDWIGCTDGRWRPVEPCTFPLAHGAPARMGRVRAYGNGLNAEQARIFIESVMA